MTVEDPVEYELDGINQTNVHARIGLTFANQLRAILRQDPDIVLVGEIRDTETADVAFRAALTGHLVLSTLHCNDAPSAVTRLIDQDVEPFLVGSAINGVVAQRLVRVLCADCKVPYEPDERTKSLLGLPPDARITLYHAVGCTNCSGSGYKGRISINEVMVMTEQLRKLTMTKGSASELRRAALAEGMRTMAQDGTEKVLAGITTIEEVQRKVMVESEELSMMLKAA
jgi:type IV pilus assembly protein PilB